MAAAAEVSAVQGGFKVSFPHSGRVHEMLLPTKPAADLFADMLTVKAAMEAGLPLDAAHLRASGTLPRWASLFGLQLVPIGDAGGQLRYTPFVGLLTELKECAAWLLRQPDEAKDVQGAAAEMLFLMGCSDGVSLVEQLLLLLLPQLLREPAVSEDVFNLLCKACQAGEDGIVTMLLDANPGLAATADSAGALPVHIAAKHGCISVLHALLEAAPDCARAVAGTSERTPLHVAVAHGEHEAAEVLAAAAPDMLLAPDAEDSTPLETAAYQGDIDMLELLLGVAPAAAEGLEQALLCAAVRNAQRMAAEWLLHFLPGATAVPAVFAALVEAVRSRYRARSSLVAMVQMLLKAQPAAATVLADADGYAVLHHAAQNGACAQAVELLIQAAPGMMECATHRDNTPLSLALFGGDPHRATVPRDVEAAMPAALCLMRHGSTEAVLRELLFAYPPNNPAARRRTDGRVLQLCSTRTPPALTAHGGRLYTAFVQQRLPLSADQWGRLPRSIAGLGAALPAALRHSDEQASQLARRLQPDDRRRLHAALACLARVQRRLGIHLPRDVLAQLLAV